MKTPYLTTSRDLIRTVAARWKESQEHVWVKLRRVDRLDMYNKLLAMDVETATPQQVDAIITTATGWVTVRCDQCGKSVDAAVTVGQEPDYDVPSCNLCRDCVKSALDLFPET